MNLSLLIHLWLIEGGKAYEILLLLLGLNYLSVSFLWFYLKDETQDEWGWTYPFFTKKGESIPCSSFPCRSRSFAYSPRKLGLTIPLPEPVCRFHCFAPELLPSPDGTPTPYTIFPYRRGNSLNPLTLSKRRTKKKMRIRSSSITWWNCL